jgi:hypothetical protein
MTENAKSDLDRIRVVAVDWEAAEGRLAEDDELMRCGCGGLLSIYRGAVSCVVCGQVVRVPDALDEEGG